MMKKLLFVGLIVMVLTALMTAPVLADPPDPDKQVSKGNYLLVSKDGSWNPLPRSSNAFGKGKFSIDEGVLTMHLVAHKLTPGDWYLVEVVDKSAGWNPFSPNNFSSFYGQADAYGDVDILFSLDVTGHSAIEVNLKNADWAALLEPSTIGVPAEWVFTGQGWGYVLYGAALIP